MRFRLDALLRPPTGQKAKASTNTTHKLTDGKIASLNRSAQKKGHASHTVRFQQEPGYAQLCIANGTPEWLYWSDGTLVQPDGTDMREHQ